MVRQKFGYAESTNLRATNAGIVRSGLCAEKDLENGMPMRAGGLVTGQKDIYALTVPAENERIVLVLSALYAYDTKSTLGQHEMYLKKAAGEPARFYGIEDGELGNTDMGYDIFSIADYMIDPAGDNITVGNYVVINVANGDFAENSVFYKEIASTGDVSDYGFVAVIEDIIYQSGLTKAVLRVVKNVDVATS